MLQEENILVGVNKRKIMEVQECAWDMKSITFKWGEPVCSQFLHEKREKNELAVKQQVVKSDIK